jgi:hypothetical protein
MKKMKPLLSALLLCLVGNISTNAAASEPVYAVHLEVYRDGKLAQDISGSTMIGGVSFNVAETLDHPYDKSISYDASGKVLSTETSSYQTGTFAKVSLSPVEGSAKRVMAHFTFNDTVEESPSAEATQSALKLFALRTVVFQKDLDVTLGEAAVFRSESYEIKLTVDRAS